LIVETLRDTPLRIPNPPAFFVLAIIFTGFRGGVRPALASAALSWLYTAYFFASAGFRTYAEEDARRAVVWALVMPLTAWLVGRLNRRAADHLAQAKLAELETRQAKAQAGVEAALRENEALLRTFVDHLADAFFLHETDDFGRILDCNRQACESLGYARDELIGKYPAEFDVGLPLEEVIRIGERVGAGETMTFETRHRRKDGTEFPVEVRARPFQHGGKRLSVGLARDVTERKRTEKALNESHDLLRAVVEGTPDAIFVKDLEGRYRMVNSAAARSLGKTAAEVVGCKDADLLAAQEAQGIRDRDLRLMAAGESATQEETVASGPEPRVFLSTWSPYRDRQGHVIGLVGIARDITEQKRLEADLLQAQKMDAVGRLAGGVAHDFNNLLSVITGYGEIVFNRMRPEDPSRGYVFEMQRAGIRAAGLTRQLLAFSRKQVLQPQVIGLNPLLADLCNMLQRLIGEGIDLTFDLDPALGMVRVDPGQFEQAVINLAVNARDAMPGTGRLTIETRNVPLDEAYAERHPDIGVGDYVLVAVSDTGHGMDEATQARIFEPFFTTKKDGRGTGLGLAMVYGFVKQSGGHIEAESAPGRGATFRLYLPRVSEAMPVPAPAPEEIRVPRGDETILLVEDEEALRTLTRLVLEAHGYTVLEARDGQEALDLAARHPGTIHLAATDMVMPRMGGRQLAGRLAELRPRTRILFMSGYTEDAELRRAEADTGAVFLPKPFSPLALVRKVRQILDAGVPAR
jgi:PAS domain S-box-containing protein